MISKLIIMCEMRCLLKPLLVYIEFYLIIVADAQSFPAAIVKALSYQSLSFWSLTALLIFLFLPQTWSLFSVGLAAALMAAASAIGLTVSVVRAIIHGGRSLLTHCRFPDAIGYSSITNECPFDPTRIYVSARQTLTSRKWAVIFFFLQQLPLWTADHCQGQITTADRCGCTSRRVCAFCLCLYIGCGWRRDCEAFLSLSQSCSAAGGRNADLTLSAFFRLCPAPVCYRWIVRAT